MFTAAYLNSPIVAPDTDAVTLHQLSRRFGITRSNVRLWLLDNGFTFQRIRIAANGSRLTLALSSKDAIRAVLLRRALRFTVTD